MPPFDDDPDTDESDESGDLDDFEGDHEPSRTVTLEGSCTMYCECGFAARGGDWQTAGENMDEHIELHSD